MVNIKQLRISIISQKKLVTNFGYLSILNGLNLIIPFAVYPYLIRVLGSDIYGVVIFAQAIISYFQILVNFGFDAAATKEISFYRNNKDKLTEIVSSVFIIKAVLFLFSAVLLIIIVNFIPQADNNHLLFYLTLWMCLYDWIFPIWYFQGVEKMKFITLFTLVSRGIFVSLVFFLIKTPDDYIKLPIINGLGAIVSGAFSLYFIFSIEKIKFKIQSWQVLKDYLRNTFPLFVSGVSVKIFAQANKVIIGAYMGMSEVAYYDLAEKIVQFLKIPQLTISQVIFPKISMGNSRQFLRKMLKISLALVSIIVLMVQLTTKKMVLIIGSENMLDSVPLLRIYSFILIFIYISQYTTVHTLVAGGYNSYWMKVVVSTGIVYLTSVAIFIVLNQITAKSLIFSNMISEFYLLIAGYLISKKLKLI